MPQPIFSLFYNFRDTSDTCRIFTIISVRKKVGVGVGGVQCLVHKWCSCASKLMSKSGLRALDGPGRSSVRVRLRVVKGRLDRHDVTHFGMGRSGFRVSLSDRKRFWKGTHLAVGNLGCTCIQGNRSCSVKSSLPFAQVQNPHIGYSCGGLVPFPTILTFDVYCEEFLIPDFSGWLFAASVTILHRWQVRDVIPPIMDTWTTIPNLQGRFVEALLSLSKAS